MKMNVYCVTNLLSGLSDGLWLYPTDKMASVELAPLYVNVKKTPLDEAVLVKVGTFDTSTKKLVPDDEQIPIEWDCRRIREVNIDSKDVQGVAEKIIQAQN